MQFFYVETQAQPKEGLLHDLEYNENGSDLQPYEQPSCPPHERALRSTSQNIRSLPVNEYRGTARSCNDTRANSDGLEAVTWLRGQLAKLNIRPIEDRDHYYYAFCEHSETKEKKAIWKPIPGAVSYHDHNNKKYLDYRVNKKYLDYRVRSKKEKDDDGNILWDDRAEVTFQWACRRLRPMGKKKVYALTRAYDDDKKGEYAKNDLVWKQSGRNELIARMIEIVMDDEVIRTRKMVSSHIQVLREKLKKPDDAICKQ